MNIKYIKSVPPKKASGLLRDINRQISRDFGPIAGPWLALSPVPEVLAGAWGICREAVVCGELPRATKEAVAVTVSQVNTCPFCVEAHSLIVGAAGEGGAEKALRYHSAQDGLLGTLTQWVDSLGPAALGSSKISLTEMQRAEVLGTYLDYQFINRVVNVFVEEIKMPGPRFLAPLFRRLVKRTLRGLSGVKRTDGPLYPASKMSEDFPWANSIPSLLASISSLAEVAENEGRRVLSEKALQQVGELIETWDGEPPPLGPSWLKQALAEIDVSEQALAKLALLTGVAAWKVDDKTVAAARSLCATDSDLIYVVVWAAWKAATSIANRAAHQVQIVV